MSIDQSENNNSKNEATKYYSSDIHEIHSELQEIKEAIANFNNSSLGDNPKEKRFNLIKFITNNNLVILLSTLVGLGILKTTDITNHLFGNVYSPEYIFEKIVNEREEAHEDVLKLAKKWELHHHSDFVDNGNLFDALKAQHGNKINAILTSGSKDLSDPIVFREKLGSNNLIAVDIETHSQEGPVEKCGTRIKQDEPVIIFVRSKSPSVYERILDCPGHGRPSKIWVQLSTPEKSTGPYIRVIGINELEKPNKPKVRITKAVAEMLDGDENFSSQGWLSIVGGN